MLAIWNSTILVISVVAFIATSAFYRKAKRIGNRPGKSASYPFLLAGVLLAIAYLLGMVMAQLSQVLLSSEDTNRVLSFMLNAFTIVIYFTAIGRYWSVLSRATGNVDLDPERNNY